MNGARRTAGVVLCILGLVLALAGCAARSEKMIPATPQDTASREGYRLRDAIALVGVSGGDAMEVSDEEFRKALTTALQARGYLSLNASGAPYRLRAFIVEIRLPRASFTTTVDSFVRYTLSRSADGTTIFDDVIHAADTRTVGEVFVGIERKRVAEEGAMRASIAALLNRLDSM